ncbi:MAG: hypothetical protein ABI720_11880 [Actinomycetes bacterium]
MRARRVVIGGATAVLALLALTAMHGLPAMGMAMPAGGVGSGHAVAVDASAAAHHSTAGSTAGATGAAGVAAPHATAAAHDAGGVPLHGHSFVHLCLAVLVAALALALARWLRPRGWAAARRVRAELAQRPLFALDISPPNRLALCVVRC